MNFTDFFIKRPVFASVLSLLILLIGLISYQKLSVRQYPEVSNTVVNVTTTYAGASAELMESFVTTPIENALTGVDGIDYIVANNAQGSSTITVYFKLGTDINTAVNDISDKVASTRSSLPSDIDDPIVSKEDPNANPTLFISFNSQQWTTQQVTDYLLRVIQPQLGTLPGVGQVQIFGGREYAMRIWLDPQRMAAHQVSFSDVSDALKNNNLQSPTGMIKSANNQFNVNATTDISTPTQFNHLVIRNDQGRLIRLEDVGHAELGAQNTDYSVIADGKNAVVLAITPQPSANPLTISSVVTQTLNKLQPQFPADVTFNVAWDSSKFIAASIAEVKKTVIEATVVVLLIMLLFLGSMRILLIPAVTIPLSLLGVCGLMLICGFSINTLTLLAMVLAIGMVVDDAIVVSENIHRHMSLGKSAFNAAIDGSREIQFAVIAMTFTLAIVFAPIGFLDDITGALFKEFAFSLSGAVIVSGFIALTLTPMMCSKIMTPQALHGKLATLSDTAQDHLVKIYRWLLDKVLRWFLPMIGAALGIVIVALLTYRALPQELAPQEDVGAVMTIIKAPVSANLSYTEKYSSRLINIFESVPEKTNFAIINGFPSGVNSALAFLVLKPWEDRKRSVNDIIQTLFPQLWGISGVKAFPVNPFSLPGASSFMPVNFVLKTTGTYKELADTTQKIVTAASQYPGLVNIDIDLKFDRPEISVSIDRNKAGDLGISMSDIGNALSTSLSESSLNRFAMSGRSYEVIPQLAAPFMNQSDAINNISLRAANGELVPLSNLVTLKEITSPENLNHFQQQRSATITASVAPGYTLGQALDYLTKAAKKIVPQNTQIDYSGSSRQFIQASGGMVTTFILALIFIYLILAAQFESFTDPLIVMFSVIPAIAGALLTLKLVHGTINIYTEIGLITLIGLISKHGILLVEFGNQQLEQGLTRREAILNAAAIRFRPILMTTASMVLGAVPLALATGAGALSRQQIGWTIVGGMTFGTLVTLFVVPCAYLFIGKLGSLLRRKELPKLDQSATEISLKQE